MSSRVKYEIELIFSEFPVLNRIDKFGINRDKFGIL